MSTFTNFNTWHTGDAVTAALFNGIVNTLVTAGNNIDRANCPGGGAGFDASYIKPSSGAAATFGGSVAYTFPLALVTTVGSNSVVPLTIQGNAGGGQTSDLLDVLLAPAGQNMFKLPAAGGFQVTGPTGTQFTTQATTGDVQIAPLINSLNTLTRVLPVYTTNAGSQIASTLHAVFGTISLTVSGTAANLTNMSFTTSSTITLSNAAVFSGVATYAVFVANSGANGVISTASNISGTQFQINAFNGSGGSISNPITYTYIWVAIGT